MNPLQNCKYQQMIRPAAIVDDGSFTAQIIDTKGYNWLTVVFCLGASDIAMAALSVQENSTNGATGMANITGTVFGTAVDIDGVTTALPAADDDNKIEVIHVKLGPGRKRYMQVLATAGDGTSGTYASCVGILSRADIAPNTATEMGAEHVLIA